MTQRAARVAQLLRDLKKIVNPNAASSGDEKAVVGATSDEYRAPKRPWEEISKDQPESSHTPTVSSAVHSIVKRDFDMSLSLLIAVSMTPLLIADGIVADGSLFPLLVAVSLRFLPDVGHKPWTSKDHKSIGEVRRPTDYR